MALDINYFKAIQGMNGCKTKQEANIKAYQRSIKREMVEGLTYDSLATVNDVLHPVLVSKQKAHVADIVSEPGNDLHVGDIVLTGGNRWIVTEISLTNPIQTVATGLLCNHLFKFQLHSTEVYESWGVIDEGSYSLDKDTQIEVINRECKIYLPRNEYTEKLYVNKRFAIDVVHDSDGNKALLTYKIMGEDPASQNHDNQGHLLVFKVHSSEFVPNADNIDLMLCDYITTTGSSSTSGKALNCSIEGKSKLRTAMSNVYSPVFYKEDGNVDSTIIPVWKVTPIVSGITSSVDGSSFKLTAADQNSLVGTSLSLSLSDSAGLYNTSTIIVEVI